MEDTVDINGKPIGPRRNKERRLVCIHQAKELN